MPTIRTLFVFFLSCSRAFAQETYYLPDTNVCNSDWTLVFQDEFDGADLDLSRWYRYFPYTDDKSDQCEFCRTHGTEGQVYTDTNVVVSDGTLKLIAREDRAQWFSASRPYTSGMIHSKIDNFDRGKYEIRCKIPRGTGFWPAFWLFGCSEIDIFEFGCQQPNKLYTDYHNCRMPGVFSQLYRGEDYSEDFHLFSIEWSDYFIRWFVDGAEIRVLGRYVDSEDRELTDCDIAPGFYTKLPNFPDHPKAIIVNLAVGIPGGPFTDAPNSKTVLPNQFEIDYIRVYQIAK